MTPTSTAKGASFLESVHLNLYTDAGTVLSVAERVVCMVNFFALLSLHQAQRIAVQMAHNSKRIVSLCI